MASVVGLTVWVELKHPPQTIVYGVVKALVPNSHLTLGNGKTLSARCMNDQTDSDQSSSPELTLAMSTGTSKSALSKISKSSIPAPFPLLHHLRRTSLRHPPRYQLYSRATMDNRTDNSRQYSHPFTRLSTNNRLCMDSFRNEQLLSYPRFSMPKDCETYHRQLRHRRDSLLPL
jgi:hypothetical protein